MMSFYEDTDVARLILAKIASYSVSLLNVGKYRRMTYSILSLVRVLSCKFTPAPICQEASSTLRIHQPVLLRFASCWGIFAKRSANICRFNAKRNLY